MAVSGMNWFGGGDSGKCEYLGTLPTGGRVELGFKPKYLFLSGTINSSNSLALVFSADTYPNYDKCKQFYSNNSSYQNKEESFSNTGAYVFSAIDSTGFTFNPSYASALTNAWYLAIG